MIEKTKKSRMQLRDWYSLGGTLPLLRFISCSLMYLVVALCVGRYYCSSHYFSGRSNGEVF